MRFIIFLIFISIASSCKQKTEIEKSKMQNPEQKTEEKSKEAPVIKELIEFAEVGFEENIDPNKLFLVKQIDKDGNIVTVDIHKGIALYQEALSFAKPKAPPLFEISDSNNVILLAIGKGYMGVIWAKILVDKTTLKIKKIQFDHKSESEGYGAEFTYSSFENKFIDTKLSFTSNTFGLNQDSKEIVKGNQQIDGISGATITSQAAVMMMNEGLKQYERYFQ